MSVFTGAEPFLGPGQEISDVNVILIAENLVVKTIAIRQQKCKATLVVVR